MGCGASSTATSFQSELNRPAYTVNARSKPSMAAARGPSTVTGRAPSVAGRAPSAMVGRAPSVVGRAPSVAGRAPSVAGRAPSQAFVPIAAGKYSSSLERFRVAKQAETQGRNEEAESMYRQELDALDKLQPRPVSALPTDAPPDPFAARAAAKDLQDWSTAMEVGLTSLGRVLEAQGKHSEAMFHKRKLNIIQAAL